MNIFNKYTIRGQVFSTTSQSLNQQQRISFQNSIRNTYLGCKLESFSSGQSFNLQRTVSLWKLLQAIKKLTRYSEPPRQFQTYYFRKNGSVKIYLSQIFRRWFPPHTWLWNSCFWDWLNCLKLPKPLIWYLGWSLIWFLWVQTNHTIMAKRSGLINLIPENPYC